MRLLESYSLSSGLKISEPYLYSCFYPIPFEKYITIQCGSGMQSKNYDYFQEVVNLLFPILKKKNIGIVQIGGPKDEKIKNAFHILGNNIKQTGYIIQNASLHIGNDSFGAHIAGAYDVPLVCIYGATTVKNHSPYFHNKHKTKFLESHRDGNMPSLSSHESVKTINFINPEEIANAGLELLKFRKCNRESIFLGNLYNTTVVEYVPDHQFPPDKCVNGLINIRMDYHFNEQNMANSLQNRYANILTDREIDFKYLVYFKDRINTLSYEISLDSNLDYIERIKRIGIKLQLINNTKDEEELEKIKMKFFDFQIDSDDLNLEVKELVAPKIEEKTKYKTNKLIFSNHKIYGNKASYLQGIEYNFEGEPCFNLKNDNDFWKDIDYLYIFD